MCGTGYRSGVVALFKRRKSPHGRQPPSALVTMCRGEAHRRVGTAYDAEALHGGELLPGDRELGRVEAAGPCIDRGANRGDVVLHTMLSHSR